MSANDLLVSAPHNVGSSILQVSGLGALLPTLPFVPNHIVVSNQSTFGTPKQVSGTYSISGAAGSTLTGLTLLSGTDAAWVPGDFVQLQVVGNNLPSIPLSALLDTLGSAQGSILYRNATGWVVRAPGTAGQVLTSGGAAADPYWA